MREREKGVISRERGDIEGRTPIGERVRVRVWDYNTFIGSTSNNHGSIRHPKSAVLSDTTNSSEAIGIQVHPD